MTRNTKAPDDLDAERAELVRLLLEAQASEHSKNELIPKRASAQNMWPLSHAQERLWFLEQLGLTGAAYNVPAARRLAGALDRGALERSFAQLVERHESLRTRFEAHEGIARQVIDAAGEGFFEFHDCGDMGAAQAEEKVRELMQRERLQRFDLARGALFRVVLVRLGETDHVLLMTMHHIISDGWSMGVLVRELSVLYEAQVQGRVAPLPPLSIQYADYAVWQRQWLQAEVLDKQLSYWRERLSGAPPILQLPTDRARPAVASYQGAVHGLELSAQLTSQLKALAQREGATLYMVLLAAFQVLLARYSGQQDIVVGSPIAGRTNQQTEGLIGFFVNTLVLRTDLSGAPSFVELLGRVKEVALGAYAHQELPLEKLIAELQPERDLSRQPLFQVMFTFQNFPHETMRLKGSSWTAIGSEHRTAQFDLTLFMSERSGRVAATFEYAVDLFERSTIERMVGHYRTLLESIVAAPDTRIPQLALLTEAERRQLLVEWNDVAKQLHGNQYIHSLIEEQAARNGSALAVISGEQRLSYAELNSRSNQLAHYLREQGIGRGSLVGVCLERGVDMIIGLLGTLKAGGAYMPMDPGYPPARLQYMLGDAKPAVILTHEHLEATFPTTPARLVSLDGLWPAIAQRCSDNLNRSSVGLGPGDLAYVIYTSGSTGMPKAVMVEHRSVVNLLAAMHSELQVGATDRLLAVTTLSFDIAALEIYLPLRSGAQLILATQQTASSADELIASLNAYEPTLMQATPATWSMLLAAGWSGSPALKAVCGGEALRVELSAELLRRVSCLWNLYGPTETTIWSCCHPVVAGKEPARVIESIGRPVWNTRVYVLDANKQPAPTGVAGEIFISGLGIARGYLNRPGATADRFVADPFCDDPGTRMYMTGDLGRRNSDGSIEFLGRYDHQVKVRGYRVELPEIESQLLRHELVKDAIVSLREIEHDKQLVAYLTTNGRAPAIRELRAHLLAALPEYMVPSHYVILNALPLTPNGKVDRNALPAPDGSSYVTRRYEAPKSEIQGIVAEIWQQLLRVPRVGRYDNFFELGGNSLLATRMIARIREISRCEVPLRTLFEAPTVDQFAEQIETRLRCEQQLLLPVLAPQSRAQMLPLSFAQERLWFLDQLGLAGSAYDLVITRRMLGDLDQNALDRSFAELIARHEVLRTCFEAHKGVPYQKIASEINACIERRDLSGLESGQREQALQEIMQGERLKKFDLAHGPLFRAVLVGLDETEHVLLITMHHIISDGWSMGILVRELGVLYEAYARGDEHSPLAPLTVQYADYALWQREWLQGPELERQLNYWRERLRGAPATLSLPSDRERPALGIGKAAMLTIELAPELSVGLRELAHREGVTLYMLLLAAFQVLLSQYSGQQDVVVGSPIAGRTQQRTEELIGLFVNMLVMRTQLAGASSFRALLRNVKDTALGAYAHQDLPFEKLVAELRSERDLSRHPLFQVMFALQNFPQEEFKIANLSSESLGTRIEQVKTDLSLYAFESDNGLACALVYAAELFDAPMMQRFLEQYRVLLAQVLKDPGCSITRVPLLDEPARQRLLSCSRRSPQQPSGENCVHELFARQAAATPDVIALYHEGRTLTYRQLDERANQLAHYLIELGVGSEVVVGLCVPRCGEMLIGLLGILKAGGAYLPLDPEYPTERLGYMLEDSRASLLVTSMTLLERLPWRGGRHVCLDTDLEVIDRQPHTAPSIRSAAENLAYVIYTSGSTGRPKAITKAHAGLGDYFVYLARTYALTDKDRFLNLTSISFDPSLRDIFGPLLVGASLVIPADHDARNPHALLSLVAKHEISVISSIVPSFVHEAAVDLPVMEHRWRPRLLFSCGERLRGDTVLAIHEMFGTDIQIVNQYGPSEFTMIAAEYVLDRDTCAPARIPIGRPAANAQLYVLDECLELAPAGVVGELYIGGDCLARGYQHRPGLTAERFIAHPFATGQRLYRTGDRVRWREDGNLEFVGRDDQQVKIRGNRVELGEIEFVLNQCHGVKQAAVALRGETNRESRLIAYVTVKQAQACSRDGLLNQLQQRLPRHMIPGFFVFLEQLPVTPNGKLDRNRLPWPLENVLEREHVPPQTELQELLASVWAEVLGLPGVSVDDNFFEMGGHSLLATRVLSRVRDFLQQDISLRVLFEAPTVRSLAERIEAMTLVAAPAMSHSDQGLRYDVGVL